MVTPIKCTTIGTESVYTFVGKSTDTKPFATNGSKFVEMDTGKEYFFDGDEQGWSILADKYLDSIEITSAPTKTSYYVSESFNKDGLAIVAKYTDGSQEAVTNFEIDAPIYLDLDSVVSVKYTENGRTRCANVDIDILPNIATDTASFMDIVANGRSVVLENNITITSQLVFTNDFEIDLNGHKLASTSNASYMVKANGATLTITGGEIVAKNRVGEALEGGTIVLEDGVFTSNHDVGFDAIGKDSKIVMNGGELHAVEGGLLSLDGANIEMNGGTIIVSDNFPIGTNGTKNRGKNTIIMNGGYLEGHITSPNFEAIGVYIANDDHFIMNGGEIKAINGAGILMRGGTVELNSGKITATGVEGGGGWIGDQQTKMSQSAVIFDEKSNYPGHPNMNLTINGGVYIGFDHSVEILAGETEPQVFINGGAFIPVLE